MLELYTKMQARLAQEDGQTMAEYAVVLAVIAIGIFVALGALSGAIGGALGKVTATSRSCSAGLFRDHRPNWPRGCKLCGQSRFRLLRAPSGQQAL